MALLSIVTYPHDVLRQKAQTVTDFDKGIDRLIDDMTETMYNAFGVGLAANQVGELYRIIIIDTSPRDETSQLNILINPTIVSAQGKTSTEEGCLSVIEFKAEIPRAERIIVSAMDRTGTPIQLEAQGIQAIALQHEIDHINGKLIIDHVGSLKREFYKRRLRRKLRELDH
ncbi:MAG: peptide deformylase [Pseudomonadota bacterium]